MKKYNVKKIILFYVCIIACIATITGLIYYFGYAKQESSYSEFKSSGYIISKSYDESGTYISKEKYYFDEDTKYKENYSGEVEFSNVDDEEISVSTDSFIHYDDGSISVLKKTAIMSLVGLSQESAVKYYTIEAGTTLKYNNGVYTITTSSGDVTFSNFIMKISDDKYLLAGSKIELAIGDNTKSIENGYYEIEYFDGDIVRIDNNESSYQSVPTSVSLSLDNGVKINLGTKIIYSNGLGIVSLSQITIDSDDNIELVEITDEETESDDEKTEDSEDDTTTTITDPLSGLESGTINSGYDSGEEAVNESTKETDPEFTISDLEVYTYKMTCNISIVDEDNMLTGDITIKLLNAETSKVVYQTKEVEGTFSIPVQIEDLSPSTSYILVVNSNYSKNDTEYTKDFIQRAIVTDSIGLSVEKDYFSTDLLSFNVSIKDYSNLTSVTAVLYDSEGEAVKSEKIDFSTGTEYNLIFTDLTKNTAYTLKFQGYVFSDSAVAEYSNDEVTYKTLKEKPSLGTNQFTIDKKNALFTIQNSSITDPDNGITSYRYEIYDVRDLTTVVKTIEKETKGSVDVEVDGETIQRGVGYTYKLIVTFYDNEKVYEYETDYSNVMKMDGVSYPTISFVEEEVTFEKISGYIVITDDGNTISLDDDSKMTVLYTDSTGITKSYTTSANLKIPFNQNGLRKNETYTISVYATIDLQDGNDEIVDCLIGSVIVQTEDTKDFTLEYAIDDTNVTYTFLVTARLTNSDATLEASTMTGLVFNLYEGTSTSGTKVKTITIPDRNLEEYESQLKDAYYDQNFTITPELFNLSSSDLKAKYYTIEVAYAYDYTTYPNVINIQNNTITVESTGYVPALPSNTDSAVSYTVIRNKDADSEHYREDLSGDTIIGYKVLATYDNSGKFAKTINYNLYSSDGTLISTEVDTVNSDGTLNYIYFYLEDGTEYDVVDNTSFNRGSTYYFTYTAELDLNLDGTVDTTYPTDSSVTLSSGEFTPSKQEPTITMYPLTSTGSTVTYRYNISDIDNTLYDGELYYGIGSSDIGSKTLTADGKDHKVTIDSLTVGYLNIYIKEAKTKTNDEENDVSDEELVYQYFYGSTSVKTTTYTLYTEINRLLISFDDYSTNSFYDYVAGAKVVFTTEDDSITLDYLDISEGIITIDFTDIEDLINQDITTEVYLYYDTNAFGFELDSDYVALQMINDGTNDYKGEYYYLASKTSLATSTTPMDSIFSSTLDMDSGTFSIYSPTYDYTNNLSIDLDESGISYNGEYIFPKALSLTASTTSNNTFKFDSIIPSVSLLTSSGSLNITTALVTARFKINLYGAGNNRIKNDLVYIEVYEYDTTTQIGTKISTTSFTADELSGYITISGLQPNTNYYATINAYVLSGTQYAYERLYDSDLQTNTRMYYFKTKSEIGISDVSITQSAKSYSTRVLTLEYSIDITSGFDRIEYDLYHIYTDDDGNEVEELLDLGISDSLVFTSSMTKTISIPPGCGVNTYDSYRIVIKPIAVTTIDGVEEEIELSEGSYEFSLTQLSSPYVGISSSVNNTGIIYKVNFYDTSKSVVDGEYTVKFFHVVTNDDGTTSDEEIVMSSYSGTYEIGSTKTFNLTNIEEGEKYKIIVYYDVNLTNDGDTSTTSKTRSYTATYKQVTGIDIGTYSLTADSNDTSKIRIIFYDSTKLSEIDTISYSIYSSSGYSIDSSETFTPYNVTVDDITYYYYTLSTSLPSAGQYYLQVQFIKGSTIVAEESMEYNYVG